VRSCLVYDKPHPPPPNAATARKSPALRVGQGDPLDVVALLVLGFEPEDAQRA
jgi:hypothetical protein